MKKSELIKQSLLYSLAVVVYVFLVSLLMSNGQRLFGKVDNVISGVAMLLLFVFSAAVTGSLVFGKPILMYLDGAKKEAVKMLIYTIIWLFFWLMLFFLLVLAIK
jgi:hypothetical protein